VCVDLRGFEGLPGSRVFEFEAVQRRQMWAVLQVLLAHHFQNQAGSLLSLKALFAASKILAQGLSCSRGFGLACIC
jgi:hypothetical protein